jgi:hypothetical protein
MSGHMSLIRLPSKFIESQDAIREHRRDAYDTFGSAPSVALRRQASLTA